MNFFNRLKRLLLKGDNKYIFGGILIGVVAAVVFFSIIFIGEVKDTTVAKISDPTETPIPTASPTPTPPPTPTPEPTEDITGKAKSKLTGLYIAEETASKRPYAVVVNNMKKALPQSGISQASIIYEVLAEGDITRLVAIFDEFSTEKLGPIRSARDYFLDFALDSDAVFVHHGGSPSGYSQISALKINNLDGMRDGNTFWRDPVRYNTPAMIEHSSYTDTSKILSGVAAKGYRTEPQTDESMFNFYEKPASPKNGEYATVITVPFSQNYTSKFVYDEETKLYSKFERDNKHIDEENGEQLTVSNIIVQFVDMHVIQGDEAGRRSVKLVSSGDGYVITNGSYAKITWKKTSHNSPTEWFDENGEKLSLNKGRTWVCVYNGGVSFE